MIVKLNYSVYTNYAGIYIKILNIKRQSIPWRKIVILERGVSMFRKVLHAVIFIVVFILMGAITYAGYGYMAKSERQITPEPDQGLVVFMRYFSLDSYNAASVFDVSENETKFLGILYNGTKIMYNVAPGEHTFMVVCESADFLKATVLAGKTYYSLVKARTGVWKSRFSFRPLRQSDLESPKFLDWDTHTVLVDNTSKSEEWAMRNSPDIEAKRTRYLPAWNALSLKLRESMTLNPEDGR
jgi:hypothetical protein